MKFLLLAIFFITSLISSTQTINNDLKFTEQEKQFIKANPVIEVGGEMDWPPFDFVEDSQYMGVANDYLKLLEKHTGLKFNVTTGYSWNELLQMFNEDKFDMLPMLYKTPQREKRSLFTKKYLTVRHYIFTQNSNKNINNFISLNGLILAIPKGYAQIDLLTQLHPEIKILEVDSPLDAIDAVLTQKADALFENTALISYLLKQNHITAFATDIGINELYMAISKTKPILHSIIQKGLNSISSDEKNKIIQNWMAIEDIKPVLKLTKEEKDFIINHPVIRVSNEKEWAPYDYYEMGEAKGYAVSYIKMLCDMLGIKIEFITDDWIHLLEKFKNKEVDIVHSFYKSDERVNNYNFTKSYIKNDLAIVTQNLNYDTNSIESLYDKKVALIKGWSTTKYIKKNYPRIDIYEVNNSKELLEAVAFGKADAGIDDYLSINYYMNVKLLTNLHITGKVILKDADTSIYMGVRKDWPILHQMLDKAMKHITNESLFELNEKWLRQHRQNEKNTIQLSTEEKIYLQQKKRIFFCTDNNLAPWSSIINGHNIGISADYAALLSRILKIPVEIKITKNYEEALKTAQDRGCDILLASVDAPDMRAFMDITSPYGYNSLVVATDIDKPFLNDFKELNGKRIGIVKSKSYNKSLEQKYPYIKFIEVNTLDEGLKAVADGKLFGQVGVLIGTTFAIKKDYPNTLKISGKSDEQLAFSIATRKDEIHLKSIFEKAINSIDENERQRILNKWLTVQYEKTVDYSLVWKIFAFFTVIIFFIIYRNFHLNQLKKEIEAKNKELESINKDLEEEKKRVNYIAFHDHLTGLPNRRDLQEILTHAISLASRNHLKLYVLFIDLDRFKIVNDTLGHHIGDEMLKIVAKRIKSALRKSDTLARVGGDEFIVLLENDTNEHNVALVVEKILSIVKEPIEINEYKLITTASIGIALYPDDGSDSDTIIKNADSAMYLAKDKGKNNFQYYTKKLSDKVQKRLNIEHELRESIINNELSLMFQPQYELDSKQIVSAEALLRWNSKKLGFISPDEFIPIAEDSGLIIEIGEWVFKEACNTLKHWRDLNMDIKYIAINVSSMQFNQKNLVNNFKYIVKKANLTPLDIEIEITERYIMQHTQNNLNILNELRDAGFKISVDDFGTGYSSMSYLKKLPLDTIKIDKSFIDDIPSDNNDVAITKAIIALSKSLEYKLVAEGIEKEEQEIFLKQHGCDKGQGYLFSRPLTSQDFILFYNK